MTELEAEYANMRDQLIEAERDLLNLKNAHERLKRQFFENGERFKTNLRAIYFLLSELQNVGTHHEKEVVLRYIKLVIDKHINKDYPFFPEADELPF